MLVITDPDSIVHRSLPPLLLAINLLPFPLGVRTLWGTIALNAPSTANSIPFPFLTLRIFTKYIAYWQHCFQDSRLFRTLSNTSGFISCIFTALVSTISLPIYIYIPVFTNHFCLGHYSISLSPYLKAVSKGWKESSFRFLFSSYPTSVGRTFRFGDSVFNMLTQNPIFCFLLSWFCLFSRFIWFIYGTGLKLCDS